MVDPDFSTFATAGASGRAVTAGNFDRITALRACAASRPSTFRVCALGAVEWQGVTGFGRVTSSRVHVATTSRGIRVVTALGASVASSSSSGVAALSAIGASIPVFVVALPEHHTMFKCY